MKLKLIPSYFGSYMLEFVFVIFILVVLSADVKTNQGPSNDVQTKSLSIIPLNIRSMRNKFEYKDNYLDCDIVCFTEFHLSDKVNDEMLILEVFGTFYRKDKTNHASGFLIFISNNVISSRLEV